MDREAARSQCRELAGAAGEGRASDEVVRGAGGPGNGSVSDTPSGKGDRHLRGGLGGCRAVAELDLTSGSSSFLSTTP